MAEAQWRWNAALPEAFQPRAASRSAGSLPPALRAVHRPLPAAAGSDAAVTPAVPAPARQVPLLLSRDRAPPPVRRARKLPAAGPLRGPFPSIRVLPLRQRHWMPTEHLTLQDDPPDRPIFAAQFQPRPRQSSWSAFFSLIHRAQATAR